MQASDLEIALRLHEEWFASSSGGTRLTLQGEEFLCRSFREKRLHESVLKKSTFNKCDLSGTKLIRAAIESCIFNECLMDGIELSDSKMSRVKFESCTMDSALIDGIKSKDSSFKNCKLTKSSFVKAEIEGTDIEACILTEANFKRIDAYGGSLSRSDFSGSDFTKAMFIGSDFRQANLSGTILETASFKEAKFQGVSGVPKSLIDCRFSKLDLSEQGDGSKSADTFFKGVHW